ncbi:ADP-ribose glycohydrolase OARD1 [Amia ocellicauda]|uniref:ADP-ribose glycohydrolase OARD1 n=1 Tax=Amia ocellicauda TaxID=2972642 RepID=UPI0034645C96
MRGGQRLTMQSAEEDCGPVKDWPGGFQLLYLSGDLFSCPSDESLAHCISQDCRMGAGIAVIFRKTFGGVEDLQKQGKKPGECAVLQRDQRFVYYLITKEKASQKPTYDSVRQSLEAMRGHCLEHGVQHLSMPRIGCGLDRLQWSKVSQMIEDVFCETDIRITVYTLPLQTGAQLGSGGGRGVPEQGQGRRRSRGSKHGVVVGGGGGGRGRGRGRGKGTAMGGQDQH